MFTQDNSSVMTTLGEFSMVVYMAMLMVFVMEEQIFYVAAVAEQVPRFATANTSTTFCCDHVRNTAAAHITYEITPIYIIHEMTP